MQVFICQHDGTVWVKRAACMQIQAGIASYVNGFAVINTYVGGAGGATVGVIVLNPTANVYTCQQGTMTNFWAVVIGRNT